MKTKKIVHSSITIFLVLIITQILGEMIVRIVAPQPLNPSLYQFDNTFSFSLGKNFHGSSKNFDYSVELFTNELGYRMDRKWSNDNLNHKILVLGDSYTFGTGVEFDETYSTKLSSKLIKANIIKSDDLLNTGIPAWGTSQELLMLQKILNINIPQLVILQICENDFDNNIQYGLHKVINDSLHNIKPIPTSRDKIRIYTKYIPFYNYLVQNSHLLNLYRRSLILIIRGQLSTKVNDNYENEKYSLDNYDDRWILMSTILDHIFDITKNQKIEILPIFIPSGGHKIQGMGFNPLSDLLFSYFKKNSIDFIDFSYLGFDNLLRFSSDGHWKPLAHEIAADSIYNHIIGKLYLE